MSLRRWGIYLLFAPAAAAAADFVPPDCGAGPFGDVTAGHPYCPWIQQFEADGITLGCDGGNYCPDAPVTRAQLAMYMERAMRGTAGWEPWQGTYRRTLIVSPVLSGDPPALDWAASGNRLLEVLGMLPTSGALDPWLVILEPGIYDIGAQTIELGTIPVTIRGAGNFRSLIYSAAASGFVLEVTSGESPTLEDLGFTISGAGAGSLAVIQGTGGGVNLERVRIDVFGAGDTHALRLEGGASAGVNDSFLTASTSGTLAAAVYLNGANTALGMSNTSATGVGGSSARGLLVDHGKATLKDSSFIADSASSTNYGLAFMNDATGFFEGGSASGFSATSVGLYVQDAQVIAEETRFSGNTRGAQCVRIASSSNIFLTRGAVSGPISLYAAPQCAITATFSHLNSPTNANGGTITCRAVISSVPTFLENTCP
jgi:hypothetical protein